MPNQEQFTKFKQLVAFAEGDRILLLRTPNGDVTFPTHTSLAPKHEKQISLLLGGARIFELKGVSVV